MTVNQVLSQVLSISERYHKAIEEGEKDETYFEVLHSSLMLIKNSLDKKSLEEMPMATKMTFIKLGQLIYAKTSEEYKSLHEIDNENQNSKNKDNKKTKEPIGFKLEV